MDSRPEKAKPQVYFVGAGPGAKDLITVRGRDIISSADVIIYAGSLVNPELLEYAKQAVEMAIEQGEDAAVTWLKDKVNNFENRKEI